MSDCNLYKKILKKLIRLWKYHVFWGKKVLKPYEKNLKNSKTTLKNIYLLFKNENFYNWTLSSDQFCRTKIRFGRPWANCSPAPLALSTFLKGSQKYTCITKKKPNHELSYADHQIYRIFDLFDVDSSASIEFDEFYLLISCFLAFKVFYF